LKLLTSIVLVLHQRVVNCALVLDPHPNCAGVDRDAYWIDLLLDVADYIDVLQKYPHLRDQTANMSPI
jgi:hypothetical protein